MKVSAVAFVALVCAATPAITEAVPVTVTLIVSNASGTVQAVNSPAIPFAGLPITLTATGDTTDLVAPPLGMSLAFPATVAMSIPGVVSGAIGDPPASSVEIGNLDPDGFVHVHARRPIVQQPLQQGAFASDASLRNYRFAASFGPRPLPLARVGELFTQGSLPAIFITPDGTVISVFALSDAMLTIAVDSSAAPAVPAVSPGALVMLACAVLVVGAIGTDPLRRRS